MARRGKKRLTHAQITEGMDPLMAEGITVGIPAEEIAPTKQVDAIDVVAHMAEEHLSGTSRVLRPHSVAENDPSLIWSDGTPDRLLMGVRKTYTPAGIRQIQSGYQCLRCDEPQDASFPEQCSLCGYGMREYQILHFSMEFSGDTHIGPAKPIAEALAEQDLRVEKARFDRRIQEGRSPMKGLKHRA